MQNWWRWPIGYKTMLGGRWYNVDGKLKPEFLLSKCWDAVSVCQCKVCLAGDLWMRPHM